MQYNDWFFVIIFLPAAVMLYYLLPLRLRYLALLISSAAFYLLSCGGRILILLATTLLVYVTGICLEKIQLEFQERKKGLPKEERKLLKKETEKKKRRVLVFSCLLLFAILFSVKYLNFFCQNLNLLLDRFRISSQIPVFHLMMPLGVSFYTLSAASYLIDISRGTCQAQRNYLKLLLFLFFFPVIVEGPISRYHQLGKQLEEGHPFCYETFCEGLQLILWGLLKKVLIADRLSLYVKYVFNSWADVPSPIIILGVCCYTCQIYMEFSGCMDMVTGIAALFGIELEPNFRRPFFSRSVNEFWRRWHITLGSWLRDYIFYPISISRPFQNLTKKTREYMKPYYASCLPMIAALFAVWFGNGIWHGAEWKYIFYGLYYYTIVVLGMLLEPLFVKVTGALSINRESRIYHGFQIFRTFCLVNLGMLIFRADGLREAGKMFFAIFRNGMTGKETLAQALLGHRIGLMEWSMFLAFLLLVIVIGILQERGIRIRKTISSRALPVRWCVYLAAICLLAAAGAYGPGYGTVDFIYAQF
ncbi:MAG: MBOAT family protein [Lachnospiraceae bacterium]|nr:MBOAT family protein [Lachnospiraceae bacterium]